MEENSFLNMRLQQGAKVFVVADTAFVILKERDQKYNDTLIWYPGPILTPASAISTSVAYLIF